MSNNKRYYSLNLLISAFLFSISQFLKLLLFNHNQAQQKFTVCITQRLSDNTESDGILRRYAGAVCISPSLILPVQFRLKYQCIDTICEAGVHRGKAPLKYTLNGFYQKLNPAYPYISTAPRQLKRYGIAGILFPV